VCAKPPRKRTLWLATNVAVALCACLAVASATSLAASSRTRATAARRLSVSEAASLHLTSHHGSILNEQGNATGTLRCPLTISLNVSYTTATISFSICSNDGTFSGSGKAQFYASGESAHFRGTVSISHGTGKYAHAAGSGLQIEGKIERRRNYALSVTVHGEMQF
jgi:hypothetical protein